jgi:hypothetical protein
MPPDKAPVPDGFNGHCLKTSWHIVRRDFYKLCDDFYIGNANLQSINESFITLVPNIQNPTIVNDFRPISLLNCSLKVITKHLVDCLQSKIMHLVHQN